MLLVDWLQRAVEAPLPTTYKLWFALLAGVFALAGAALAVISSRSNRSGRTKALIVAVCLFLLAFVCLASRYHALS
ncbi:hypothetical protein AB0J71_49090 [Nonomuraea sp. NPDC049637]|uniref:hypothetical protein n=1 Tax=Nonomuraea sp. NPDC049637 TaxID=3154356 RepID=UPI003442F079